MANVQFVTVKSSLSSESPVYLGVPQHNRIIQKSETYDRLSIWIGYKPATIRAAFLALKEVIRENSRKGNTTQFDGVATVKNTCKGAFASMQGPWVKGVNYLMLKGNSIAPFKAALSSIVPTNKTGGANPIINSVYDGTTGLYDVITGTNSICIAGVDLGPDTTKTDEYVALVSDSTGVETKMVVTNSDLGSVTCNLATALTAGAYTLKVYTRSNLGSEFGVKVATRKITVA